MGDLIAFLRARLADDEQTAKAATWDGDMSARWQAGSSSYDKRRQSPRWYVLDAYEDGVVGDVDPQGNDDEGVARHIARHDPARVLAEVDAKRQIIEQHERYAAERRRMMGGWDSQGPEDSPILTALASVYADHPDYRDEWRP
ncbi:DUF6221 family protein [Streptomyces sp. NPDC056056]|uniref:DUF6221 family protein n=1 Tax=Streptomyces sp. NPDC056056 TaxID=3345698 RepID=UPI0035DE22C0